MRVRDPATGRYAKAPDPTVPASNLTASIAVLPSAGIDKLPPRMAGWQERAWRLWRILGVLHYPTSFKAKQVARLKWKVEVDGKELDEEQAEAALEAVTQPLGTAEAARRLALNLEVAGEVYYARSADEWCVYAPTMPKLKEALKKADIIVREWTSDPERPDWPASAVMAALNTFEQIRLMCALSRAQDRNRITQRGILLIPKEGQFPDDDPFMATLEAAMQAPLANEYAPESVTPPVVTFPAEYIDKWRYLTLDAPYDEKLMDRIEATIRQAALELDMPPEMLLGNLDSNHWNAWLSSEENYRAHVEPLGVPVGDVFAEAMMQAVGDGTTIVVTPDPSDLLRRILSVEEAFEALFKGVVGYDYVRRVIGAEKSDKPTPADIDLIMALQRGREQITAPGVPQGTEVVAPALPPASNGKAPAPAAPQPVTAAVDKRKDELDRLGRQLTDIDIRLLSVLEGLAGMAVDHARVSAKPDEVGAQAAVHDQMQRLGKAWNREVSQARKVLSGLGIDTKGHNWDEAQQASVHLLVEGLTQFTMDTLNKTDAEMPALPVLVLRRVLATAGGSGTATVAAITRNPAPTFQDPQGFALGVNTLSSLKDQNINLIQWRFRYGPLARSAPFEEHKAVDGQYMSADGETSEGWSPGDHKGCECWMDPIFSEDMSPDEVADAIAEDA